MPNVNEPNNQPDTETPPQMDPNQQQPAPQQPQPYQPQSAPQSPSTYQPQAAPPQQAVPAAPQPGFAPPQMPFGGPPVVDPSTVQLRSSGADPFPGSSIVRIDRIHYDQTRKGAMLVRVRATHLTQTSQPPDDCLPPHLRGMPTPAVGSSVGWIFWCQNDYYHQEITEFLLALNNATDPKQFSAQNVAAMIQDPTPYAGYCIQVVSNHYYPKAQRDPSSDLPLPGAKGRVISKATRALSQQELQQILPPNQFAALFQPQG